jgi:hypothetical protein
LNATLRERLLRGNPHEATGAGFEIGGFPHIRAFINTAKAPCYQPTTKRSFKGIEIRTGMKDRNGRATDMSNQHIKRIKVLLSLNPEV